jgi:pyruvate/2-oxoglutarate dehydrogenase complex dihydrolipoamide acyltransferase (E2) component
VTEHYDVFAPDLGAVEPVRVSAWLVEVGETVREGDRLVELLVPGLTYDVAALQSGRLAEIVVPAGASVRAGNLLGRIEPDESV